MYQEEHIGKVIVNYFQNLFSSMEGDREETVNYALSPMISADTNEQLTLIPTSIEVKEALFSIHADKAPDLMASQLVSTTQTGKT